MLNFGRGLTKYIGNISQVKLYEPNIQQYLDYIEHLERIIDYHSKSKLYLRYHQQYFELKNLQKMPTK